MNNKQFLLYGGIILLVLGIVGFIEGNSRLLGNALWFDNGENYAHTILGIVAIVAAYALGKSAQRTLVGIVGVVALVAGVWGFLVSGRPEPNFFGANLENPIDNLLHIVVGGWAFWAMRAESRAPAMGKS